MRGWADQAATLREAVSLRRPRALRDGGRGPRSVAVASGKGGVGKTFLATNLAVALARRGTRVLLVDADLSLANVHILLNLRPAWSLADVVRGEKTVREILVEGPEGFHILPASSGVPETAELPAWRLEGLLEECGRLSRGYDLILIDLSAGVSPTVMAFIGAAEEVLLVTTPEPAAYTDAYALLKMMRHRGLARRVGLVVNSARDEREGRTASEGLVRIGKEFLGYRIRPMAVLPQDGLVPESARKQRPVVLDRPRAPLSRKIGELAEALCGGPSDGAQVPFFQGLGEELRRAFLGS